MATKNLIPRGSGEGGIGITDTVWGYGYYDTGNFNKGLFVSGKNIDEVIADAVAGGGLGGVWNAGAGGIIYYNGGNVGIGTMAPVAPLDVHRRGTVSGDQNNPAIILDSSGAYANYAGIEFRHSGVEVGSIMQESTRKIYINSGYDSVNAPDGHLILQNEGGNVGIGTRNPGASLTIESQGSDTPMEGGHLLDIKSTGNSKLADIRFEAKDSLGIIRAGGLGFNADDNVVYLANDGEQALNVSNNGNVGIGTADPAFAKLQIEGSSTNTRVGLLIGDTVGRGSSIHQEGNFLKIEDFTGNSANLMAINTLNGKVGIGTANPECPLMIKADPSGDNMFKMLDERAYVANEARAGISFQGLDSGGNRTAFAGVEGYGAASGKGGLRFLSRPAASSTAVGMVLNEDGNVGIGTSAPAKTLDVNGKVTFGDGSDHAPNTPSMSIKGSANISGQLTVDSTAFYIGQNDANRELRLWSGQFTVGAKLTNGSNSFVPFSCDRRSKENIAPLENVLDKVLKLSPSRYDYKEEYGNKDQIGFIAQEVNEVLPEFYIPGSTEDKMSTVKFSDNATTALLVKAIQEQQSIIEELKSRIETLENK